MADRVLPAHQQSWRDVVARMKQIAVDDPSWDAGTFNLWWPSQPPEVALAAREAILAYSHTNAGFAMDIPSLGTMTRELQAMVAEVLQAPDDAAVTLTGGGTESNMLAVKTARDRLRATGSLPRRPNLVIPYTAHPSFDRAADLMGYEVIRVAVGDDFRPDARDIAEAINDDTFFVAASAPSYTHGVIDPIAEIAEIAHRRGVWFHIDACVSGFLIPYWRRLGRNLPAADFTVPGVRSISADLHKFGYCLTGISTFTLAEGGDQQHQAFDMNDWPYGRYRKVTITGSRPGGPVAAAWAVIQCLGDAGYLAIARRIMDVTERLLATVNDIPELELVGSADAGVVAIGSQTMSIPSLVEAMRAQGYATYRTGEPPALHLLMDPIDDASLDRYVAALIQAADDVRTGKVRLPEGEEAIYSTQ